MDKEAKRQADLDALRRFGEDARELERMEILSLSRFNILEAIGFVGQEIKHSRFLAFLLDPKPLDLKQNHGLVEASNRKVDKLQRPVFFGESGTPTVQYEIDGYPPEWKCDLEVEAGRGWMGNAVYRDLVQAAVRSQWSTFVWRWRTPTSTNPR